MLIGYARVSTVAQDLTAQVDALNCAGCERIFSDKASGTKNDRAGLGEALSFAREGDLLVVWKLDRLGRSMKGLVDLAAELSMMKVGLRSITDGIDTSGTAGKLVFHILAAMAEMESDLVRERTAAGLEVARAAGKVGGRKLAMTPRKIASARKLLDAGAKPSEVAADLGISRATLYRHLPASERGDA